VFRFPLPPIRPLQHDGEAYELAEDLLDEHGRPVVEAGYVTDLASVPRPFRVVLPTSGKITPAAIRHDKRCDDLNAWYDAWIAYGRPVDLDVLYHRGVDVHRPALTSVEADREFLDGLRQLDPEHPVRNLGYWVGVRLGALGNPARRDGWTRDARRVILAALVVAPLLLPVAAVNAAALVVDGLANRLACRLTRRRVEQVVAGPAPALPEQVAA
jgi:hypothetical protein